MPTKQNGWKVPYWTKTTPGQTQSALINLKGQLDEGSFLQVLEQSDQPETTMTTSTVMQIPQNEEKNLKRGREDATTSARETSYAQPEIRQEKRQKMNPVFE